MSGPKRRYNAGFLLVELSIAIVLLSFFFFIASSWYSVASRERAQGLSRLRALRTACQAIERCRSDKNFLKTGSWQEEGIQLTWHLTRSSDLSRFQLMRMNVKAQEKDFQLTTGFCQ